MTALRKSALEMLQNIPEEKLTLVLISMREIQDMPSSDDASVRHAALQRLESMIKPSPDVDYEKELALWREEKFGNARID